jgi:hypothetical protein
MLTTLLDPQAAPAQELAELNTARWTSETISKHIKIEQRGGRTATLRSMSPAMVEQELWAMLCVYQAVQPAATGWRRHGTPCTSGCLPVICRLGWPGCRNVIGIWSVNWPGSTTTSGLWSLMGRWTSNPSPDTSAGQ